VLVGELLALVVGLVEGLPALEVGLAVVHLA
jgi:hypothetical protein